MAKRLPCAREESELEHKRRRQSKIESHLFERDSKVDVDEFARGFVDEDVRYVTITESEDVTNHRCRGDAPRVVQAHLEPKRWDFLTLPEQMSHQGRHLLERLGEGFEFELLQNLGVTLFRGAFELAHRFTRDLGQPRE